jgi:hypothetical protein
MGTEGYFPCRIAPLTRHRYLVLNLIMTGAMSSNSMLDNIVMLKYAQRQIYILFINLASFFQSTFSIMTRRNPTPFEGARMLCHFLEHETSDLSRVDKADDLKDGPTCPFKKVSKRVKLGEQLTRIQAFLIGTNC